MTAQNNTQPEASVVRTENRTVAWYANIKNEIIKSFISAYAKYFTFSGRTSRYEYFAFMLTFIATLVILIAASIFISPFIFLLYILFIVLSIIPMLALTNRRLHDTGRNLWNGLFNWYVYSAVFGVVSIGVIYTIIYTALSAKLMLIFYGISLLLILFAQIRYLVFICKRGGTEENKYGKAPVLNDAEHEKTAFWMIVIFFVITIIFNIISFMLDSDNEDYNTSDTSYYYTDQTSEHFTD